MATPHTAPVHTMVVGVFDDPGHARAAETELRTAGFSDECICFIAPGSRPHAAGSHADHGDWEQDELNDGKTILTVEEADERAEDARDIMRKHGATIREPSPIGTYGTGLPATPF